MTQPRSNDGIMVERLTAQELASLAANQQALALNEVIADISAQNRMLRGARILMAEGKKRVLLAPDKPAEKVARAALEDAKLAFDHIKDRISMLRLHSSILQSLLRVAHI
jgi:hypothetical protein